MYGISIALLIGSTLRRDDVDYELKGFLRSFAKVDIDRRKKEKYRIRQVLKRANFIFHPPMERKMYLANLQSHPPGSRRSGSSTPGQSGSGVKASKSLELVKSQVQESAPSPLSVISEGDGSSARKSSSKASPETQVTQSHDVHTAIVHTSSPDHQDMGPGDKVQPVLLSANPQQTFVTIPQAEQKSFRPVSQKHHRVIVRVPAVCPPRLLASQLEHDSAPCSSAGGRPDLSGDLLLPTQQPTKEPERLESFRKAPKHKQDTFKRLASHQRLLVTSNAGPSSDASASNVIVTPQSKPRSHSAYDLRGTFRQTAC